MKPQTLLTKKLPFILLALGIFIIFLAITGYFSGRTPSYYTETTGTIISESYKQTHCPNGKYVVPCTDFFPIIAFKVNGSTYKLDGYGMTVDGTSTTDGPTPDIGQNITISYNPSNPSDSPRISGDIGPLVFGILGNLTGIVLIIVSVRLYIRNRKLY